MNSQSAIILLIAGFCLLNACSSEPKQADAITQNLLENRLQELSTKAVNDLALLPLDSTMIPRSLHPDGKLYGTPSRSWTSGFYPGTIWQLYDYSKEEALKEGASTWSAFIEKEKWDTHTHDLGFKVFNSIGKDWQITGDKSREPIIRQTSATLIKRYRPTVGAIRSWDFNKDVWQFPVIIDNMMNLEMLFETSLITGDSIYYEVARQHAETTMDNHFREDNSSYHVIDYDTLTGEIRNRHTHQGTAHESAWARGQAWGLYGFTMVYRYTQDRRFLEKAIAIAQFLSQHPNMPEDQIPYWDFDAPNIPNALRDVSAATIIASALLELQQYVPEKSAAYLKWADQILLTLQQDTYQASTPPFLLTHSVGNMPSDSELDVPIVYADYYYVEALMRRLDILTE